MHYPHLDFFQYFKIFKMQFLNVLKKTPYKPSIRPRCQSTPVSHQIYSFSSFINIHRWKLVESGYMLCACDHSELWRSLCVIQIEWGACVCGATTSLPEYFPRVLRCGSDRSELMIMLIASVITSSEIQYLNKILQYRNSNNLPPIKRAPLNIAAIYLQLKRERH
jgi:hypothetical protein